MRDPCVIWSGVTLMIGELRFAVSTSNIYSPFSLRDVMGNATFKMWLGNLSPRSRLHLWSRYYRAIHSH